MYYIRISLIYEKTLKILLSPFLGACCITNK
jgi:hypothetical protein